MKPDSVSKAGKSEDTDHPEPQTIVLNVLSPSFHAPNRISFNGLPLATTISEVKARITLALSNRPAPEIQRLIYRGKVLSNNDEVLAKIVEPLDSPVHSIHLVLPPSAVSRDTVTKPSSTQLAHPNSAPNLRSTNNSILRPNTLRFRGSQHVANESSTPDVLNSGPDNASAINQQQPLQDQDNQWRPRTQPMVASQPSRWPLSSHETNTAITTDDNSTIWNRSAHCPHVPQEARSTSTVSGPASSAPNAHTWSDPLDHQSSQPSQTPSQPQPHNNTSFSQTRLSQMIPSLPVQRDASYSSSQGYSTSHIGTGATHSADIRRHNLRLLGRRIVSMEMKVAAGDLPSTDEMSSVRSQLYQYLEEQHRNPVGSYDESFGIWLSRLSSVTTRADQILVSRSRSRTPQLSASNPPYLLFSPSGYQGVIMPPAGPHTNEARGVANASSATPPPLPRAARGHGRVNQALNPIFVQQRHRHRIVLRPGTLVRALRGFWLFIRLYFFCYVISARGTWFRFLLVSLAGMTAILSETNIPRQLRRTFLSPLQRHLEDLIPLDANRAQEAQATNDQGAGNGGGINQNGQAVQHTPATPRLRENLRSLERAVVLFITSLVPGISERHIAARNAANVARENEDRMRQEQENQAAQQENDSTHADDHVEEPASQNTVDAQTNQPGEPSGTNEPQEEQQ